jgi:hypothetical protein
MRYACAVTAPDQGSTRATAGLTAALMLIAILTGCGGIDRRAPPDAQPPDAEGGACTAVAASQANGGHQHTAADCDPVTYATNPPASGTHYPTWAAYQTYTAPIPWGFLVHDLEHGAIVMVYNCPEGCADEAAQAQALIDGLGPDPSCGGAHFKIVLAPAPDLDVRWAAAAWTWTLRSPCFDRDAFAAFIAEHYDGPDTEAACESGADLSARGWCP